MSVSVFNLAFHLAPFVDNDAWRENVRQLQRRRRVFNGRKLVGVALGAGLHDMSVVRREFDDWADELEFFPAPNEPALREATTFLRLFEQLRRTSGASHATFRAHAKGVSRPRMPGVIHWRDSMYRHLLDDLPKVVALLERYPCVGCYRMQRGRGRQPWLLDKAPWYFAGTFFWVRDSDLFARDWRRMPAGLRPSHAVEAYLGTHFSLEESACVHGDHPERNPYYMTEAEAGMSHEADRDVG